MGGGGGGGVLHRLNGSYRSGRILSRAIHIAVIGTGPSAFYTSKYLLKQNPSISVHMIERLPAPFGLVRYGVAPDHPETKIVTNDFQETLNDDRCQFFGNVEVGKDISIDDLRSAYDGVVVACGAASDKSLGIPGENLKNSVTARAFVNWYNGHPDHANDHYNLNVQDAVIIGNGNVALDVARVLCCHHSIFQHTDMSESAREVLQKSSIKRVSVVGRRGAPQAAYTNKELREIVKQSSFPTFVSPNDIDMNVMTAADVAECSTRAVRRKMEILSKAQRATDFTSNGLYLRFNLNPVEFIPDPEHSESVGAVVFERTRLSGEANRQVVMGSGEFVTIKAGLVIRSVGYRSQPVQGLPFDECRKIIPNLNGRVIQANGEPVPRIYSTGWIKRGPTGIIGSNIIDAQETVAAILSDIKTESTTDADRDRLWKRIAKSVPMIIDKNMWKMIDTSEIERGKLLGKPRSKYIDRQALIAAALGTKQL